MTKKVKFMSLLLTGVLALAGCGGKSNDVAETLVPSKMIDVPAFKAVNIPESEALSFVEDMGVGWSLGNTFDATGTPSNEMELESAWCGHTTTQENIKAIADAGFKTIRIPVSWHNHVDSSYNISEQWLARVKEVVEWALEEDLYVIINIHHDNEPGFMYPDYEHLETSKWYVSKIWKQLAECFAEYDEKLIFEVLNEPRLKDTPHEWSINPKSAVGKEAIDCVNQLNQVAVDTIRENGKGYNTSRYIMVPGYCASPDTALADAFVLPTDNGATKENRILVSVHAYTPYNFALAAETDGYSTSVFSIAAQNGTKEIENFISKLYDKFVSKGTGVVIGEFGARAKGDNTASREEYAAFYVACARHYGISTCWWDNNAFVGTGENFGIYRRANNTWLYSGIVEQLVYYSIDREE